jgi:hypothetical protein
VVSNRSDTRADFSISPQAALPGTHTHNSLTPGGEAERATVTAIFELASIFLPALGYGSDLIIWVMSRRNHGEFKPEYRFLLLAVPSITGVVSAIIYGQAGSFPQKWHWSAILIPYHGAFFSFLRANIVSIT